jgi:hypothetical protein
MTGHEHAKLDYLNKEIETLTLIKNAGNFQNYASKLPNINEAFLQDDSVECVDGRVKNGFRLAGSGIYFVKTEGFDKGMKAKDAISAGLNAASKYIKASGKKIVTSHKSCGAAGVIFRLLPEDLQKLYGTPDNLGMEFSKELAHMNGLKYNHIAEIEPEFHNEICAYYDGTGSFRGIPQMPTGFVITRKYLPQQQAVEEADLVVGIALGDHGYHNLITQELPFRLVAVADKKSDLVGLVKELQPIADKYNGRVAVDGFARD